LEGQGCCTSLAYLLQTSNLAAMKHKTELQRHLIVTEHAKLGSVRAVATKLGINRATVRKWIARHATTTDLKSKKPTGRPPLLDTTARTAALNMLVGPQAYTPTAVAKALHDQGLTPSKVSRHTVVRGAKAAGKANGQPVRHVKGLPKKALTAHTKQARLQWAQEYSKTNWKGVMFTDRKRFEFKYPGVKATKGKWVVRGQRHEGYKVNHAQGVNLYAGFTVYGMTKAHIVAGTSLHKSTFQNKKGQAARNITSSEYKEVMMKTLLPEGSRIFSSQGVTSWTFQQDNDPTHKVGLEAVKEYNKKKGSNIVIMTWPPNSPDLSPIENVWAYLNRKVQARGCSSFAEFKAAVLEELRDVPKSVLTNLCGSMKERVKAVLQSGGDKTKY
jgi:transposase